MDYKIHLALPEERDLIYTLKAESVRPYVEKIWGWDEEYQQREFDRDFEEISQFNVIEVEGSFAGYVQYYAHSIYFEITEIHLRPEYRGKGIGSDILRYLQRVCIAQDRYLRIGCFKENHGANRLYQRLGFVRTEETATHFILEYPDYRIIPYEEKYRDDMIFMVLQAKDALGRVPTLNEDLLDIQKNYLENGDQFWLAMDSQDRVVGCIGYNTIPGTTEVRLHRLYVKAARKRQGIGTRLLHTAERHLRKQGKTAAHVHLGGKEYFESRSFYPKHGYREYAPRMMKKGL